MHQARKRKSNARADFGTLDYLSSLLIGSVFNLTILLADRVSPTFHTQFSDFENTPSFFYFGAKKPVVVLHI